MLISIWPLPIRLPISLPRVLLIRPHMTHEQPWGVCVMTMKTATLLLLSNNGAYDLCETVFNAMLLLARSCVHVCERARVRARLWGVSVCTCNNVGVRKGAPGRGGLLLLLLLLLLLPLLLLLLLVLSLLLGTGAANAQDAAQ